MNDETQERLEYEKAVKQYAGILDALKALYDERDRTLHVIWSYMEKTGAQTLLTPTHEVTIPTKRQYDVNKFQATLGEDFPECVVPEHEVTKVVPAKVDGKAAQKLWQMDYDTVAKLERTLIPQKPEVKLKARKITETPL